MQGLRQMRYKIAGNVLVTLVDQPLLQMLASRINNESTRRWQLTLAYTYFGARGGRIRMPCTHLWWWIWMTKLIGGYGSMVLKSASCLSGFYDDARMPETCSSKSAGCIGWWWTCQAANMVTLCNLTLALSLRAHTGDWYACDLANTSSGPKVKIRRQLILQLSSVWALQPSHVGLH
jgi:hypothetical protein